MSTPDTTILPTFLGRESKFTGPMRLDYENGEFWVHGMSWDGKAVIAPFMVQRDGESLPEFMDRVRQAEAAIDDQR